MTDLDVLVEQCGTVEQVHIGLRGRHKIRIDSDLQAKVAGSVKHVTAGVVRNVFIRPGTWMLVAIELFLSVHPTWRSTMKSAVAEETRGSDPVAVAGWFLGDLLRTLCCIKLYAAVVFDFVHSLSVQVLIRPGVDKRILTTRVTEVFGTEVLSISSILISCFSMFFQT